MSSMFGSVLINRAQIDSAKLEKACFSSFHVFQGILIKELAPCRSVKMATVVGAPPSSTPSCFLLPSDASLRARSVKPTSLSWASSFPSIGISIHSVPPPSPASTSDWFIRAAYTRRSRGELVERPNRKSWKQRTDMYMRLFLLNVFFSKRFVHAKVMHRRAK